MKKILIAAIAIILFASCGKQEFIIKLVGNKADQTIKLKAISAVDMPYEIGDTVIVMKRISEVSGERNLYHILNQTELPQSWIKYDTTYHAFMGADYSKAVIIANLP